MTPSELRQKALEETAAQYVAITTMLRSLAPSVSLNLSATTFSNNSNYFQFATPPGSPSLLEYRLTKQILALMEIPLGDMDRNTRSEFLQLDMDLVQASPMTALGNLAAVLGQQLRFPTPPPPPPPVIPSSEPMVELKDPRGAMVSIGVYESAAGDSLLPGTVRVLDGQTYVKTAQPKAGGMGTVLRWILVS